MSLYDYDNRIKKVPFCGIDEAGRGPLAGPVVAAAVVLSLKEEDEIEGLNDSKKLSQKKREKLCKEIMEKSIDYSIGIATVEEIEEINILKATFLAMQRALEGLKKKPVYCIVDGNRDPNLSIPTDCVIKGDSISASIAAASIIAKVKRDEMMIELDRKYPNYGFSKHKGYGTKFHYEQILKHGITKIHRKSFLKNLEDKKYRISNINGNLGEKLAYGYLKKNNYNIVAKNYKSEYGEIDLIAQKDEILVFIEVKYRNKNCKYSPKEAVTKQKQRKIVKTALEYIRINKDKINKNFQPRFDVIEIKELSEDRVNVNMIENAFSPEEEYGFI